MNIYITMPVQFFTCTAFLFKFNTVGFTVFWLLEIHHDITTKQISMIIVMSSYELCPRATVLWYMPRLLLLLIEPLGLPRPEDACGLGVDCCSPGVDCCLLHQRPLTTSNEGYGAIKHDNPTLSLAQGWLVQAIWTSSLSPASCTLDLAVLASLLIWVEFTSVPDSTTGSRRTSRSNMLSFLSPVFLNDL